MTEKLKKCPFCKKNVARLYKRSTEGYVGNKTVERYEEFEIRCLQCGCGTGWYHDKAEAIEAWNRRSYENKD